MLARLWRADQPAPFLIEGCRYLCTFECSDDPPLAGGSASTVSHRGLPLPFVACSRLLFGHILGHRVRMKFAYRGAVSGINLPFGVISRVRVRVATRVVAQHLPIRCSLHVCLPLASRTNERNGTDKHGEVWIVHHDLQLVLIDLVPCAMRSWGYHRGICPVCREEREGSLG